MTAPLRSFLPEDLRLGEPIPAPMDVFVCQMVVALVAWAAELSDRIDALPLAELSGLAAGLEQHPLLRRLIGA